ncbi:MAG TPA: hypothetical protein VN848_04575 [Gemmatimonadales bacterium]|nr:hypothetical protein [Gemmatimonadales bacterium]
MPTKPVAIALALAAAACTSMQRVQPAQFIPAHNPNVVSVWSKNHVTFVTDPQIAGDTLTGTVLQVPWAVPLKDVDRVEARATDPTRTLLLFAGAAASTVGLLIMSTAGRGAGSIPCPPDLSPFQKAQQCGVTN